MYVQLIQVPFDSGHWGVRMGRGPEAILSAGAADRLRAAGHAVELERVQRAIRFPTEVATGFEVVRSVGVAVRSAVWHSRLPILLAGNCMSSVGVAMGTGTSGLGVVWLDAHADYNTPESSASGFVDGMALAVLTGRCWRAITTGLAGFEPVPPHDVVLVGAHDVDPAEATLLEESGVVQVPPDTLADRLPDALTELRQRVERIYLHLDLDVLRVESGRANGYGIEGVGLGAEAVVDLIRQVRSHFHIAAVSLTAYDPEHDPEGQVRAAALEILEAVAAPPS